MEIVQLLESKERELARKREQEMAKKKEQQENERIRKEAKELNIKNKDLTNENNRLKRENESLKSMMKENNDELVNEKNRLKRDCETLQKEIDEIKSKMNENVEELMKEKNRLKSDNENLRKEIAEIKSKMKGNDDEIINENNRLKSEIETLRAKISQIESKSEENDKEKANEIDLLKKENEALQLQNEQFKEKLGEHNEDDSEKLNELKKYLFALKEKVKSIEYVNIKDYKDDTVIGESETSTVKIVIKKEKYAKKELKEFTHKKLKRFILEGELLFKLRHPCIIRIHGFYLGDKDNAPFMILTLEPKSLEAALSEAELTEEQKNRIIVELVLGMRYIHNHKFIHRSLKPSNILLSKNNHVRISDFGLAKEEDLATSRSKGPENLVYMAPELFDEDEEDDENKDDEILYTNKVDVYSFGMILVYIITNTCPKFSMKRFKSGSIPPLPENIQAWVQELISKCLSYSPKDRPSFSKIFKILKENNYDIFNGLESESESEKKSKSKKGKLTKKQRRMKEKIEARINKIEGFEFQHQGEENEEE